MGDRSRSRSGSLRRTAWDPELLHGIIDASPDLIIAKDRDGRLIFANAAFGRQSGMRPEELVGKSEREIGWVAEGEEDLGKGDELRVEDADREAIGGATVFVPSRRYRIQGHQRFFDITRSPLRDSSGEVVAEVCAWHDITTFHVAVEELRRSAERYRAMSEYSYEWEVWQDADGRILYMSPSFERITGHPVPDFLADPGLIRAIVHPDDRDAYEAHRARTLTEHGSQAEPKITFRIVRRDGMVRWIEHSCRSVFRPDGSYMGRRATNRDITETRLAEERLRSSELKFRVVFENSPLGKSLTDMDGTVHVNRAFCELLGYEERELRSKNWRDITHPDDVAVTERALEPLLRGHTSVARFEKRYLHKSGAVVRAEVVTFLQRDEKGLPLFYITTITGAGSIR